MPKIVALKEDWVHLGFKLFSRKGVSGLIVEKMAATLGCNKSSFYWHFTTKEAFINELVTMWSFNATEQIINLANRQSKVWDRYHSFVKLVFRKDPYLDFVFHLKRYAINQPLIQLEIDRIDAQRIQYVQSLLVDLGKSDSDARIAASILYKYLIGFFETYRFKPLEKGYLNDVKRDLNVMLQLDTLPNYEN